MMASGGGVGFGEATLRAMQLADARELSIWYFAGGFIVFDGFAKVMCQRFQLYQKYGLEMMLPNQSLEPTAGGVFSSAVAVHATSRRWLSFFR